MCCYDFLMLLALHVASCLTLRMACMFPWTWSALLQVVQHFTQLGLDVVRARISSDGGWFVDVFDITEATGAKVTDERKLQSIKQVRHFFSYLPDK